MKRLKNKNTKIFLGLIFLAGVWLRFYNLNWDQGHFFHPDERNIAAAVARLNFFNQLNPGFFAYGSLPIYLYRLLAEVLAFFSKNRQWLADWSYINLIGRHVSAFFASLTILLAFFLAQKLWNSKTGLLAAFLIAFCPSLIQTAHYGVTESLLIFWLLLVLFVSFKLGPNPSLKNYLFTGFLLGLAVATKISALSFFIIPLTVQLLYHLKHLKRHLNFVSLVFVSFLTFFFFSPYVLLDQKKFLESIVYETGVSTGRLRVCYTLQFENTLPYLFQIKNFFWQMGPVALIGFFGLIVLFYQAFKKKDKNLLVFLSFPGFYFAYVGSWYTKFIRYSTPLLPFLALAAAWLSDKISKKQKNFGLSLKGLFCLLTFGWSLAFFSIYLKPATRIVASQWIYQNIPQGSKILGEHWDDNLPLALNQQTRQRFGYDLEQLTIYEPDNEAKSNYYAQKLAQADYLVLSSRRLYGTLLHLTEKYPLTSRYYQLLFAGQLGYQKVAEFTAYPSLLGLTINDDASEESFQVYDHPKIIIFKNQKSLTENNYRLLLMSKK